MRRFLFLFAEHARLALCLGLRVFRHRLAVMATLTQRLMVIFPPEQHITAPINRDNVVNYLRWLIDSLTLSHHTKRMLFEIVQAVLCPLAGVATLGMRSPALIL